MNCYRLRTWFLATITPALIAATIRLLRKPYTWHHPFYSSAGGRRTSQYGERLSMPIAGGQCLFPATPGSAVILENRENLILKVVPEHLFKSVKEI